MDRQEAFNTMAQGGKITHHYFADNEYYFLRNDSIIAEDGVNHTKVFWSEEANNWRKDGWEIYNPPNTK